MSIINKGIFDLRTAFARQTGNDWPTAQVITTSDVIESSSNLYFTNTRVFDAVTIGTIPGSIAVSANLVANGLIIRNINVSDSILTGNIVTTSTVSNVIVAESVTSNTWNGIYTANVIETSGNLYFTNTRVVSALIPGVGIIIEANGRISANVSDVQVATQVNNLDNLTTTNLAEGTNLYYTNTRARTAFTAGKGISIFENGKVVNTGSSALYNLDINGSAGGNVLSTMSTMVTFPSSAATNRFLLRSLHVVNMSDTTSLISGNILYATGNTASIANQIPVAVGGVLEFIKTSQLFQPGDKINLQGFNSAGTATANLMTAMITYETFDADASFIGIGQTIANSNTNTLIYDSAQSYSIIESIKFVNLQNAVAPIRAYWSDANGTPKAYLAYNLQIPPNSSVELLQAPKRLELGDEIYASYTNAPNAAVSVFVSARVGPTYIVGAYTPNVTTGDPLSVSFASTAAEGSTVYYTIE
jgi:hypothetical protein